MILTCPSCGTRYQTAEAQFTPPGRNVRCAKCRHVWFQAAPELETPIEPEPVISPAAPEPAAAAAALNIGAQTYSSDVVEEAEPPPRSRGAGLAQAVGWLALFVLLGAIGWATITYRETIASVWPPSASLYRALGMPVNVRGVTLTNISYKQEYEGGQPVLSVTGKIVNVSNREQPVPEIRVVLMDDAKRELYHWTFDAGVPTLKPGAETPFTTRLSSPPADARNLNVRFAEAGDTR
jgi:predicted Zn finger-like uncharacterized protein